MRVIYQIVHDLQDINPILIDALKEAHEFLYIEKTEDDLKSFYEINYNFRLQNSKYVAGFGIDVEEISTEDYDYFLKSFSSKLNDDEHIIAIIKFHDETRFDSYIRFYREIAELEMQLREILSCIFEYAYSANFFNLLEEHDINFPKDTPDHDELQARLENEFFYLTFGNYLNLDKPKDITKVKDINSILESSDSYEDFRDKICNRGIKNEIHLEFLAAIKQDLQTIESVRNSVAHNRSISSTKLGHYETAKSHLLDSFKEFWEQTSEVI